MSHAAAVAQDTFSYGGDSFFVEASGSNRHRRATVAEIRELLHPSGLAAARDPAGHWYEAQCTHYGLRPSKVKAVAKTRLLDALNGGSLVVPEDVRRIEVKLKKQWDKDERLARQKVNAEKGGKKRKAEPAGGKGKEAGETKRKKIGVKIEVDIDDHESSARVVPSKQRKTATKEKVSKISTEDSYAPKKTPSKSATTSSNTKQTARGSRGGTVRRGRVSATAASATSSRGRGKGTTAASASVSTSRVEGTTSGRSGRSKMTARRSRPFSGPASGRINEPPAPTTDTADNNIPRSQMPRQTARRSRPFPVRAGRGLGNAYHVVPPIFDGEHLYDGGPLFDGTSFIDGGYGYPGPFDCTSSSGYDDSAGHDSDDASNTHESEDYEQDSIGEDSPPAYEVEDPNPSTGGGPPGLINGRYEITCDSLQDTWSEYEDHQFSLVLALRGDAVWGAYDLGMYSGILHLPRRPYRASGERLGLSWRGVENAGNMISWDDEDQTGWIRFLGGGRIEGGLRGMWSEEERFQGVRVSEGETRSERSAASMMQEWGTYTEDAYEEARVGRWH